MSKIDFAFSIGDTIEVRDTNGAWRAARVTRLSPFAGEAGYFVVWLEPAPRFSFPRAASRYGSWTYEFHMRPMGTNEKAAP